jgi:hypothetical protein
MPSTPEELLTQLAELRDYPFPRALINEMIQRQQEMIPALLAVVEDASQHPQSYIDGGRWKILIFAAYLLAQFRETRAFKPLCAALGHSAKVTNALWGDTITEGIGSILASVYDGDDAPLRDLIQNRQADEFVRGATVPRAFLCLIQAGKISRTDLEAYAEELLSHGLEREPSFVWEGWTSLCCDLGFARLCDPFFYGFDEMLRDTASGKNEYWKRTAGLIDDTIKETSSWGCWSKPAKPKPQPKPKPQARPSYLAPVDQRTGPKIGRNDPCPCGSGTKYKKCCGAAA